MFNIGKILRLFILFGSINFSVVAQNKISDNFKGIIPFITTKDEVENKIGKPDKFGRYEFPEGRVYVFYREIVCDEGNNACRCLASLGTVLKVSIHLYNHIPIKSLKLSSKEFEKKKITGGHVSNEFAYINTKKGIVYEVQKGKVIEITYYESEKTCSMLKQKLKDINLFPQKLDY